MPPSLWMIPPGTSGAATAGPPPGPAAPLVSGWRARADAGEPRAVVRVRELQSAMAAGRDAWGRAARPQPVLLSSEVSFAGSFAAAAARDAVGGHDAGTAHYGNLSKALLGGMAPFSPTAVAAAATSAKDDSGDGGGGGVVVVPRTADVFEMLWVAMTGRVVDGSRVALPPDRVPFLDAARLRSLALTLRLPKASLLGAGVSLAVTACFRGGDDDDDNDGGEEVVAEEEDKPANPLRSYARCLRLHGLHIPTLIGVNSNERTAKQMVVVDVEIDRFDVYEDIHAELERIVVETLDASSFETLEALGTHVGNKILDDFRIGDSPQPMRERGWQVRVCLEKPIAVPFADCPSVEVRVG